MFRSTCLVFLVYLVTKPIFTSVVNTTPNFCSVHEHACGDGSCVDLSSLCDGHPDCSDVSDERVCSGLGNQVLAWNRAKRQSSCRKSQWQCRDGNCIGFDGKCDGVVDCPDGSDETFPLCRKMQCQSNWFRCMYGACVDGSAPCNGVQDCADNSDELLPRCRKEVEEVRGRFKCKNGQFISSAEHCDGVVDCADGSDETLETCAAMNCPGYLFQCAYGACVDQGSACNGKQECADGSDESDELCNRISPAVTPGTVTPTGTPNKPSQGGNCRLPPYPQYGKYTVTNIPGALPGETYTIAFLNITCDPGFMVEDMRESLSCYNGVWSSEQMPKCVRFCRLPKHPSVEYRCISTGAIKGSRECGALEPSGTVVTPECRSPNYYNPGVLSNMNCIDGYWDFIAKCKPGSVNFTNITITINGTVEINVASNHLSNIVINNYANNDNVKIMRANSTANNENIQVTVVNSNNSKGSDDENDKLNSNISNPDVIHFEDSQYFNPNMITGEEPKNDVNSANNGNYNKYGIDEGDWRIGQAQAVTPKNDGEDYY